MTDTGVAAEPELDYRTQHDAVVTTLGEALDEIYRLRGLLAWFACETEADLHLTGFPKSRRTAAERRVDAARQAARGESDIVRARLSHLAVVAGLDAAGAERHLTRHLFENQQVRIRAAAARRRFLQSGQ